MPDILTKEEAKRVVEIHDDCAPRCFACRSASTVVFLSNKVEALERVKDAAKNLASAHYRVLGYYGSLIDLKACVGDQLRGYGGEYDEAVKAYSAAEAKGFK